MAYREAYGAAHRAACGAASGVAYRSPCKGSQVCLLHVIVSACKASIECSAISVLVL